MSETPEVTPELYVHPLNGQEYRDEEIFAEVLLQTIADLEIEKSALDEDRKKCVAELNKLADPSKTTGVVRVPGLSLIGKLERRENVNYKKEEGEEHPLIKLARKFNWLQTMLRVKVEEKGSDIKKMLQTFADGGELSDSQKECCEELLKVRVVTQGTPGLTIEKKEKA